MKKHTLSALIGLSSTLLLTACGGSSGSDGASAQVTRGTIDGFGSVIVNGVRFNTDDTAFDVKDTSGAQSDLRVGQVVTITGSYNGSHGVATRLSYDVSLEGPVTSIDAAAGSFVVLGQTVVTNHLTAFEDVTLATLAVGHAVEVSGYTGADGQLLASFVERDDDTDGKVELRGKMANLDESAKTFTLRSQRVRYDHVAEWDLDGAAPADGLLVEVEGTVDAEGTLVASKIEADDDDRFDDNTELKLSGLIRALDADARQFMLNGMTVVWNSRTEFEDDLTAAHLADNLLVEVEGRINAGGVLVAEEIDAEDAPDIELEAPLTAVTPDAGSNFTGTVTVLGVNVQVNLSTRVRDDDDDNYNPQFNLSQLRAGDFVELNITGNAVEGYRALSLERDRSRGQIKLEAPVTQLNPLTVLGVEVNTSNVMASVPAGLKVGDSVEIEGSMSGNVLIATEFEADDDLDD